MSSLNCFIFNLYQRKTDVKTACMHTLKVYMAEAPNWKLSFKKSLKVLD